MSAVDEYKALDGKYQSVLTPFADAAIAELEAQVREYQDELVSKHNALLDAEEESQRLAWASTNKRLKNAELEARLAVEVKDKMFLGGKLREAEAEVERLKCCGNCANSMRILHTGGFRFICNQPFDGSELNPGEDNACHFEPSRWAERGTG